MMPAPWRGIRKGPLTRFFLLNTRPLGVYLHRIDRPDADRECHDHPWSFVSVVLRGGYAEERLVRGGKARAWRWAGSVAYRRETDAHRITAVHPVVSTWTLIIRFRDRDTWGFYLEEDFGAATWSRWIHWKAFDDLLRARAATVEARS